MTCQIVAHSVGADAPPLVTFQVRYPRIIHAELMTHRVFSRNARSSRAVPVPRLIEEVMNDPFIPRYWGANQKGMQAGAEHDASVLLNYVTPELKEIGGGQPARTIPARAGQREMGRVEGWLWARDQAVAMARAFHDAGYHKQIVNRLLEPFMHIDVLITATEWSNFFALRDDDMAEPHIRDLARAMKEALAASTPVRLDHDQWHLPYVDEATWDQLYFNRLSVEGAVKAAKAVSVTRCARISYTPFHGEGGDITSEVARYEQLVNARPMHSSPLEHQATPDLKVNGIWEHPELHGNLRGWIQLRKTIPGESA